MMFRKNCLTEEKLQEKFYPRKINKSLEHGFQTTNYPTNTPLRRITNHPLKFQDVVFEVFTQCQ
jgi:hypothetical protein